MTKDLISGQILIPLAHIWAQKFFSRILPPLEVTHCCKLSLYVNSKKTKKTHLRKWQKKTSFIPNFGPFGPYSSHQNIFFANIWLRQTLDIMASYHHIQYQKKNNDPILRKLSDGRKDGRE